MKLPQYIKFSKYSSGFNLIELLVAVSIMGILFGLGYANFRGFSRRQSFQNAVKMIQADLRLAQSTALAGQMPSDLVCNGTNDLNGYFFNIIAANHYEIRASCTGGVVSSVKKDVILTNGITIAAPFPVPNPILFKVLGSGTNLSTASTTINLLQSGNSSPATITINIAGQIQ